jgi:hypothetical protein
MRLNYDWTKDDFKLEEKLKALNAAYKFAEYTFSITENRKYFPFKYKMIVDSIRNHAMTIPILIDIAKKHKEVRTEYGQRAIDRIDDVLFKMKLLYKINNNLGAKKVDEWKRLACDIKYLTIAWIYPKK